MIHHEGYESSVICKHDKLTLDNVVLWLIITFVENTC